MLFFLASSEKRCRKVLRILLDIVLRPLGIGVLGRQFKQVEDILLASLSKDRAC